MTLDEEKLVMAIGLAAYILLGGFFAWLIGAEQWSLAWVAVVVLWPAIGFILFMIGMLAAAILQGIFSR